MDASEIDDRNELAHDKQQGQSSVSISSGGVLTFQIHHQFSFLVTHLTSFSQFSKHYNQTLFIVSALINKG